MICILEEDKLLNNKEAYKVHSKRYSQVEAKDYQGEYRYGWHDGFVAGNGENGVINGGSPYDDTLIYQNINFIMPKDTKRDSEDISYRLDQARRDIVSGESYMTDDEVWYSNYCFHPGGQLRISQEEESYSNYIRWCDYETGELAVKYTDKHGDWERFTFTSRVNNATITKITKSSEGKKVNVTLSYDDILKMYKNREAGDEELLEYKKLVDEEGNYIAEIAHYPTYKGSELAEAGYATLVYVVTEGGTKKKILGKDTKEKINVGIEQNPQIEIRDADSVYLIAISDRDLQMGALADFKKAKDYPLISQLLSRCKVIQEKYTDQGFNYDKALEPSALEQASLYNALSIKFGDGSCDHLPNEELISLQGQTDRLNPSMVERAYNAGRYAMIACSGSDSISRLYGMWTGEWAPRWNGGYTMDANVNVQASGMNASNCISYSESYIRFVMKQIDDWKLNALRHYGFENAIQCPCNTDGSFALSVEYSTVYPFEYWNHGAAWMIQPIYEFYQTHGNRTINVDGSDLSLLEDILKPLLELNANFWEQMLTPDYYTDSKGYIHYEKGKKLLGDNEYYCILPGYSPENMPKNKKSARAANCTADISAARKSFEMLILVNKLLDSDLYKEANEKWENLIEKLPPYLSDETGAIKEWASYSFDENNEHRHISHLYCAWPSEETQSDEKLLNACLQVIENRNKTVDKSEESQTHGWLHKGLVAARLKDRDQVDNCLSKLLTTNVYYDSMLTDHNTDRISDCFCTDTALGIVGVINEMLLYSDTGIIEVLPALIDDLKEGSIKNLMTKTQAQVSIKWKGSTIKTIITSKIDQTISISFAGQDRIEVPFKKDETKTFERKTSKRNDSKITFITNKRINRF